MDEKKLYKLMDRSIDEGIVITLDYDKDTCEWLKKICDNFYTTNNNTAFVTIVGRREEGGDSWIFKMVTK